MREILLIESRLRLRISQKCSIEQHEGKVWQVLDYQSWKEYCAAEFQFSKARSYQLLGFVEIKKSLTDTSQPGLPPANEKQTRALSKLEPASGK